jgi:hypothetical protein
MWENTSSQIITFSQKSCQNVNVAEYLPCTCSDNPSFQAILNLTLFLAKSTFFHAGQREKKYFFYAEITFFHAGITFFHAGITFFSRWKLQRETK